MPFKTMLAIGCGVACLSATAIAEDLYKFLNEIPIGGEGGWDILTIDAAARRLYLSHATKVVVVDLEKNAVVGEIADTPGVHAFAAGARNCSAVFRPTERKTKSSVVDLKTLQDDFKNRHGRKSGCDRLRIRSAAKFTFSIIRGNSATVIDAKTAKVVATIPLGGSRSLRWSMPRPGAFSATSKTKARSQ